MRRTPAVAGQFYQGTASKLTQQVRQYINTGAVKNTQSGYSLPSCRTHIFGLCCRRGILSNRVS